MNIRNKLKRNRIYTEEYQNGEIENTVIIITVEVLLWWQKKISKIVKKKPNLAQGSCKYTTLGLGVTECYTI